MSRLYYLNKENKSTKNFEMYGYKNLSKHLLQFCFTLLLAERQVGLKQQVLQKVHVKRFFNYN